MTTAIVGGGPSGLVSAKSCLEENIVPKVYESCGDIGGLWNPQHGLTWDNMRTNLSRYTCMFSDFPWQDNIPPFPSRDQVYDYLKSYTRHFNLEKYIHCNTTVVSILKCDSTSKWIVKTEHETVQSEEIFDYVIVSSGFFSKSPSMPDINITGFKGRLTLSHHYRRPDVFKGLTVAVVGGSLSGTDIAADIAGSAEKVKVIHIKKRNFWVLPKFFPLPDKFKGATAPLDLAVNFRKDQPSECVPDVERNKQTNEWFSKTSNQVAVCSDLAVPVSEYDLPPHVVISETYLDLVKSGQIKVKVGHYVVGAEDNRIILENGESVVADAVVLCCGYRAQLPFFSEEQLQMISYQATNQFQPMLLHKTMFHPQLHNLAFVGMYRGPFFGIMELQARWAAMAFARPDSFYPTAEEMKDGIDHEKSIRDLRPPPQFPHEDYVGFADDISKRIGVYPTDHMSWRVDDADDDDGEAVTHEASMTRRDDSLCKMIVEASVIPSQFRLEGPHAAPEVASSVIREFYSKYFT